ncbi:unnamed protein product, partial [Musa textilis]
MRTCRRRRLCSCRRTGRWRNRGSGVGIRARFQELATFLGINVIGRIFQGPEHVDLSCELLEISKWWKPSPQHLFVF